MENPDAVKYSRLGGGTKSRLIWNDNFSGSGAFKIEENHFLPAGVMVERCKIGWYYPNKRPTQPKFHVLGVGSQQLQKEKVRTRGVQLEPRSQGTLSNRIRPGESLWPPT